MKSANKAQNISMKDMFCALFYLGKMLIDKTLKKVKK